MRRLSASLVRRGAGALSSARASFSTLPIYPAPAAFVGKQAPDFTLPGITSSGDDVTFSLKEEAQKGRWSALLFYPKDVRSAASLRCWTGD